MNDFKCLRVLTDICDNTAKATRYENRDRDVEALKYAMDILKDRIWGEKQKTPMYEQVKAAFEVEDEVSD